MRDDRRQQFRQSFAAPDRNRPFAGQGRPAEVGLGRHSDPGLALLDSIRLRIDGAQSQNQIGPLHQGPRPPDPLRLDRVGALAQPRRVHQQHRQAFEVQPNLQRIPRRARNRGDDRDVAPGQRVEQARLAGIGRAGQDHDETLAHPLAHREAAERLAQGEQHRLGDIQRLVLQRTRDVALIGKVDLRRQQGHRLQQLRAPLLRQRAERAVHLPQRLSPLPFRLRIDQIGETFHRGEVELARLEGAAGEFPGFGQPDLR